MSESVDRGLFPELYALGSFGAPDRDPFRARRVAGRDGPGNSLTEPPAS